MMTRAGIVRLSLLVAIVVAAVAAVSQIPVAWLEQLADWVVSNPVQGAAAYLVAATLAGVLMTPGWIPMMLAGFLFGLGKGVALAAAGIVLGSTAAFILGRTLMRGFVEKRIADSPRLRAIDGAVDQNGFSVVLLTRLALVLPYNVLNYAYGITRVRTAAYVLATAIGMLPPILLYVYFGTLARNVREIIASGGSALEGQWWIAAVGLTSILLVTIVIQRAASRAMAAASGPVGEE